MATCVRNLGRAKGVYKAMHRGFVLFLCVGAALGQAPQRPPIEIASEAYYKAHSEGRFGDAAARRDEARSALARIPAEEPRFAMWAQNVAQLYANAGLTAAARTITGEALARTNALGESNPGRVGLLGYMAGLWMEDRNLLKALSYREQAVAAMEAAPKTPPPAARSNAVPMTINGSFGGSRYFMVSRGVSFYSSPGGEYRQLADLYQQLGRKEALSALLAKVRNLPGLDPAMLASFYEQQGQLDDAAALHKRQAEQAAANSKAQPWDLAGPLQSLANVYERQERWDEALASLQQSAAVFDSASRPELRGQGLQIRLRIADVLNRAGKTEAAGQLYERLLAEVEGGRDGMQLQVLTSYARYLSATERGAQAEELLQGYLAGHANLDVSQDIQISYALAETARLSGRQDRAEQYERSAAEKQRAAQKSAPLPSISTDFQNAQSAASKGDVDTAFTIALHALDAAAGSSDREQAGWQVPGIADAMAARKVPERGEQLYQRLFEVLESWQVDTRQPMLNALQQYPRFLMNQKNRWLEVPAAIERYRNALTAARGAGTGAVENALHLTIDFDRISGRNDVRPAEELVALEESLSGATSQPYLQAIETLAGVYQASGNPARALPLHRQIVAIADVVYPAKEVQRGFVRINAALAFARAAQFDEAERLANQAAAIAKTTTPPSPDMFVSQLREIEALKKRQ
jgi:hypothetical protein